MVEVPADAVVVVFIDDGDVLCLRFTPAIFVVAAFPEGTDCADDGDFGVCLLDAVDEEAVALQEGVSDEVFVADAEIL